MDNLEQSSQQPTQMLAQQLAQLQQLSLLIEKEKTVLAKHDHKALNEITEQKNHLLLAIQSLDKTISEHPNFVAEKAQGLYTKLLEQIASTLEQCQYQNEINGKIIQQSQLAIERMKTTVLESRNSSSITYDSKGKKTAGLSSLGLKA